MVFATDESVWDDFLEVWPLERLRTMTLDEYTKAGDKDTFTYWIESRLDRYGSIWGGSAFKFAIYSRSDKKPNLGDTTRAYTSDYAWYRHFGGTPESAFKAIRAQVAAVAEAARAGRLSDIDDSELGTAYRWKIAFHYQDRSSPRIIDVFLRKALKSFLGIPLKDRATPTHELQQQVMAQKPANESVVAFGTKVWSQWLASGPGASAPFDANETAAGAVHRPRNLILFGPPGTGKTYRTVDEALEILDATFLDAHKDDRPALKRRFDELAKVDRIRFVTFHQSFSYEDFVEGIRATTDDETHALRYEVADGVFKEICDAARSRAVDESDDAIDLTGRRIWKMSLGEAVSEADIYDDCIANNYVLLGFGADIDYADVQSAADIRHKLVAAGETVKPSDFGVTAIDRLVRGVKVGDLVVISQGNLKFRAIGEVTGGYQRIDRGGTDSYSQSRPVRWLRRYDPAQPYTAVMKNKFSQMSIYELHPGSIDMDKLAGLLAPQSVGEQAPDDYVLIIDEINRGNVSRIFGELITLIEPSKRAGQHEALEVVLPYSKEPFSVPSNVHLIGTMNTADRSLAGLDVALRRRFEFVEVMPDSSLLAGVTVEGVPIDQLLAVMNQRIEVLMGRDYMLGHAYFLGLRETPTIGALAAVFRDKVLPLLQEYFYDDWQKIAWVLNDHRKPERLRFVRQIKASAAVLFGEDVELPAASDVWQVNARAFDEPAAYQAIIAAPKAAA